MRIDLHTHSSISDGTDEPADLVKLAGEAGLGVVALTDHDTYDGIAEAQAAGQRLGTQVLSGMELSCSRHSQSVHLLAYGADPADPKLSDELKRVRGGRLGRLPGVLAKLAALGVPVSEAAVMAQVGSSPSVGRPHIADALIAAGHVKDRQEAFDRFLADGGPAHVHRYAIDVERGIELVHRAGGLAVIAHPWGRGRRHVLPLEYLEQLTHDHQLDGVEVDHQDHDPDTRRELRKLADRLGLLITGSSDYHGTGKQDHDLGCNTTAPEVFHELSRRIEQSAARRVTPPA